MPTYYKYAEREADSYINWAEIGKNMSDMLANENKIREEKKAAIDAATREFGQTVINAPQGESRLMNEWALKFAGNMEKNRLMQDKLLKSGQLKLNDYIVMRQNAVDGTTNAFNLVTDFQKDFKEMWDRMAKDESAGLEQKFAREVESFGDFAKTDLYIDPATSKVNVAFKEKKVIDGKEVYVMSDNPNKFSEINDLRNRFKMRVDKYKLPETVTSIVNSFGEQIQAIQSVKASLNRQGMVMEITDILKKEGLPEDVKGIVMTFKDAETNVLKSQLSNPYNAASILDDWVNTAPNGKIYDYTWDPKEAESNPELILLKNEAGKAVPVLSEEQNKIALEKLRVEARMRYDYKEKMQSTGQLQRQDAPQYVQQKQDDDKTIVNTATLIGTLWGGADGAAIKKATTAFRDINPNIQSVKRTPTGVTVTLLGPDGKTVQTRELPFYGTDKKLMSQQDFIMSAGPLLGGNADWKTAVSRGGFLKGATFNSTTNEASEVERETTTEVDYKPQITQYAKAYTNQNITTDAPKTSAMNLNKAYNRFGFTFTGKSEGFANKNDYIQIKASDGTLSDWIPVDNKDNVEVINQFIIDNIDQTKAAAVFPKAPR